MYIPPIPGGDYVEFDIDANSVELEGLAVAKIRIYGRKNVKSKSDVKRHRFVIGVHTKTKRKIRWIRWNPDDYSYTDESKALNSTLNDCLQGMGIDPYTLKSYVPPKISRKRTLAEKLEQSEKLADIPSDKFENYLTSLHKK